MLAMKVAEVLLFQFVRVVVVYIIAALPSLHMILLCALTVVVDLIPIFLEHDLMVAVQGIRVGSNALHQLHLLFRRPVE